MAESLASSSRPTQEMKKKKGTRTGGNPHMEERRREERYERPEAPHEMHEERVVDETPRRVERERYDDRDRRVRPVDREPVAREYRREPEGYGFAQSPMIRTPDMIRWGSVWAGVIGAFGLMIALGVLGVAVGLAAGPEMGADQLGTASAIWGVVVGLLGFFVGGLLAGRTSAYRGPWAGFIMGSMVWALGVVVVLLLSTFGAGGVMGAFMGAFGDLTFEVTPGAIDAAQSVAIGTFVGLLVTYIAAVAGGILGARADVRDYEA
jgi:hypothetical protein